MTDEHDMEDVEEMLAEAETVGDLVDLMVDVKASPADRAEAARAFLALRPDSEQDSDRHACAVCLSIATPGSPGWVDGEVLAARVRERRDAWRKAVAWPWQGPPRPWQGS